jgi:hypothetical protein
MNLVWGRLFRLAPGARYPRRRRRTLFDVYFSEQFSPS